MKRPLVLLSIALLALAQLHVPSFAKGVAQRPYRLSDQFKQEKISDVMFSPDGRSLAYTRTRAISTLPNPMLIDEARSDVWLQDAPGQQPRNLTNGASDQSGWWAPQWSPDGENLAMLSSRGGDVGLWVWERSTNQLRQISRRGVEFDNASNDAQSSYRWIDSTRLLYQAYLDGEPSLPSAPAARAPQLAALGWARAAQGELTASVVDSLSRRYSERQLVLVDLTAGSEKMLAKMRGAEVEVGRRNWWYSPKTHVIALLPPKPASTSFDDLTADIDLYDLDGKPLRLVDPLPANIATTTLRFSPDGNALVFFAWGEAPINPALRYGEEAAKDIAGAQTSSMENPARLWRVDLDQGEVEEINISGLDLGSSLALPDFRWMASGELLIHAVRRPAGGGAAPVGTSPEWMVLGRNGVRALSAALQLTDDLQSFDGGKSFIGLKEGEVWRIDPQAETVRSLTEGLQPAVSALTPLGSETRGRQQLVLSALRPPKTAYETMLREQNREWRSSFYAMNTYYRLDLSDGSLSALIKPDERAQVLAYDFNTNSILWYAEDRRGTFLWRSDGNGLAEQILATNTYLRQIDTGGERIIEYTTLNGERMQARIVLPPGYKKGRRYPLVVDFDIGYTAETSSEFAVRDPLSLPEASQDPFPAAGYVYMFASWPSTSMDDIGRANLLLGVNGIIPAVEKAIELGIADPNRLFLFGTSSAGYGVYALITQTSRFKAAAAHAGWVDMSDSALSIHLGERYGVNPFGSGEIAAMRINRRFHAWRIADLLRRNSPLNYVDRVQTPLLILHGDLDLIPIDGPEQFFKALVQQRKPARFVRYWGEGHGNRSPANMRDYWQQVFSWYDEWGDIARGADGEMLWDGNHVSSRNGDSAASPEDYLRLNLFE